jgi:hypothetical protein
VRVDQRQAEDPRGAANRLTHLWLEVTRETVFLGGASVRMRHLAAVP